MSYLSKSINRTLVYSDIFDYPLKKEELWKFLISSSLVKKEKFEQELKRCRNFHKGYYFLPKRKELVQKRIERTKESKKKLKLAKRTISVLSYIPTIKLIGISGALAMKNADKNDDIDLFIIAKDNTLWTTRLLVIVFLEFLGVRRRKNEKSSPNKICLNMMIDESALFFRKNKQDLYTAHEIVQMRPIYVQGNVYERFLDVNSWIARFIPNSIVINLPAGKAGKLRNEAMRNKKTNYLITQLLIFFEILAKTVQLLCMKRHRTTEIVSDKILAFHPNDYNKIVRKEYNKKLKKYVYI